MYMYMEYKPRFSITIRFFSHGWTLAVALLLMFPAQRFTIKFIFLGCQIIWTEYGKKTFRKQCFIFAAAVNRETPWMVTFSYRRWLRLRCLTCFVVFFRIPGNVQEWVGSGIYAACSEVKSDSSKGYGLALLWFTLCTWRNRFSFLF